MTYILIPGQINTRTKSQEKSILGQILLQDIWVIEAIFKSKIKIRFCLKRIKFVFNLPRFLQDPEKNLIIFKFSFVSSEFADMSSLTGLSFNQRLIRITDKTLDVVFSRFRGFSFTITLRQKSKGVKYAHALSLCLVIQRGMRVTPLGF